jgi:hypothetical protein
MSDKVYSGSYPFGNDEFEAYRGLVAWRELTQALLGAKNALRLERLIGEICLMDAPRKPQVYILLGGPRTGKTGLIRIVYKVVWRFYHNAFKDKDIIEWFDGGIKIGDWYILGVNDIDRKYLADLPEDRQTYTLYMTGETFIKSDYDSMVEAIEDDLGVIAGYCRSMYLFLNKEAN